jgi:sortase A
VISKRLVPRFITGLSAVLLLFTLWQWGSAGWILAKAQLAQWLIASAWAETLVQPQAHIKPWPWADTWPVARLQFPEHKVDLYVLAGAQGNSLAFGPGQHLDAALPGAGMSVIGGHRDTHFRFLKHVAPGDHLLAQTTKGQWLDYRVVRIEVVNIEHQRLLIEPDADVLLLVTCYPFDAINPNGPERLLVWTERVNPALASSLH